MTAINVKILQGDNAMGLSQFFAKFINKLNKVVLVSDDYVVKTGEIVKVSAGKDGQTTVLPSRSPNKTLVVSIKRDENSLGDVTYKELAPNGYCGVLNKKKSSIKLISLDGDPWKKW